MKTITPRDRWITFIAMSLCILYVDMNIVGINIAVPWISHDLKLDTIATQWLVNGALTAAASVMALAGRLGDIKGEKRIISLGLILFTLTSLAVGFSFNENSVLFFRILQGISMGFIFGTAIVIVSHIFPAHQQGIAIGSLTGVFALSQAFGPFIIGIIINYLDWHWVFFIMAFAALSTMILVTRIPETMYQVPNAKMPNWVSVFFLVLGTFTLVASINNINIYDQIQKYNLWFFLIGVACLIAFVIYEYQTKNPLLHLEKIMNRNYLISVLSIFFIGTIYFAFLFSLGLYFQNVLQFNSFIAGLFVMIMTVIFAIGSLITGRLIDKVGYRKPLLVGSLLAVVGLFIMLLLGKNISPEVLVVSLVLLGLSIACIGPAAITSTIRYTPKRNLGGAIGLMFNAGLMSAALGIAMGGRILSFRSHAVLADLLSDQSIILSENQIEILKHVVTGVQSLHRSELFPDNIVPQLSPIVHEAFAIGFNFLMIVCFIIALLLLLCAYFYKDKRVRK